jgi:hypothetical protein
MFFLTGFAALCRLGHYSKDDPASFQLIAEMAYFPGFMFHLRRSQFVQVFGNSPDETAFARLMLMKEVTQNCMLMIQPQLHQYSIQSWEDDVVTVHPVPLDVQSILPGSVFFLDTYFYLVVYHGNDIAHWRQEGCAPILIRFQSCFRKSSILTAFLCCMHSVGLLYAVLAVLCSRPFYAYGKRLLHPVSMETVLCFIAGTS